MSARILEGACLARDAEPELRRRMEKIRSHTSLKPTLATILVGSDPASATYVRMKGNACGRVGLEPLAITLPEDTDTDTLRSRIEELNAAPEVCGILLQHPVPAQIDERLCFDAIAPEKDVDGVSCLGFGRISMGVPAWGAATPAGIMRILRHYEIPLAGRRAVVLGRSPILGKPMAMMLLNENATVTICHSRTRDLPQVVRQAEILVAAVGRPEFVRGDWVADGAVVVDAGYHPQKCGDVALQEITERVSAYTPVPGGVGPMTINTLILHTVAAAEKQFAGASEPRE